jgi:hypothetical protein
MKTYYIYYLPNAERIIDGELVIGKVGYAEDPEKRVVKGKSWTKTHGKLNITGWKVLETLECTQKEVEKKEVEFQIEYKCLDGRNTKKASENLSIALKDTPRPWVSELNTINKKGKPATGRNTKGSKRTKVPCKYCSREIGNNVINLHENACKKKTPSNN